MFLKNIFSFCIQIYIPFAACEGWLGEEIKGNLGIGFSRPGDYDFHTKNTISETTMTQTEKTTNIIFIFLKIIIINDLKVL